MNRTLNKFRTAFLSLACALTFLCGCSNQNEQSTKEVTDEFVTQVIEASNPKAEVHIGEFDSILTGEVEEVSEEAQTIASSTILDMPKDQAIHIVYNDEEERSLMAVSSLLKNIVSANNELQTVTIKDRGGNLAKNLLSTDGAKLTVAMPGGFAYGEVYQIEIHEAPYLSFENKSSSVRTLTVEIEDDPEEETTYDEKQLQEDIVVIDRRNVTNEQENADTSLFSFDYEGVFPELKKGDVFFATIEGNENAVLDFYGVFASKTEISSGLYHVEYQAPQMSEIYQELRMKNSLAMDLTGSQVLLNEAIAAQQFKNSSLAKAIVKAVAPHMGGDVLAAANLINNFKIRFDINIIKNRLSMKFSAGIFNYKLKDQMYLSVDAGYEKQTDYTIDFDVSVRTKWIFPVGVDYKIKCIEDTQEQVYIKANLTVAFAPETQSDSDFVDEIANHIDKLSKGDQTILHNFQKDPSLKTTTSGTKTTFPLLQVDLYYFEPLSIRFKADFYIDAGFQALGLGKKEVHSTKVNFNFSNVEGTGTDDFNKITKTSNWMLYLSGSAHVELGVRISLSFSILGLHNYLHAVAYAEFFINISFTGSLLADISTTESGTDFTGYIGIDFAVTIGMRVGLDFKVLFVESNINKTLWLEYLFRINYENSLEHWSTLAETSIEMPKQTMSLNETSVLFISYFDSVTLALREKKYDADSSYSIFSGALCPSAFIEGTSGHTFTYEVEDSSLIEIDENGTIHVKDGTPTEFTTTFTIKVSNWAGSLSDRTITLHFTADDGKEAYVDDTLIGVYRTGNKFTLPEGPEIYGKKFLYYSYEGQRYEPGQTFTMTEDTLHLEGVYRDLEYFNVYFYDGRNNLVAEDYVMEGYAATAPSAAMRDRYMGDGFAFLGWSVDFSSVTSELSVYGVYVRLQEAN